MRASRYECGSLRCGSSPGLQRVLGVGSYETAWTWLHKLRRAMVRPGRDRLTGAVKVDEIYIGGREKSARCRESLSSFAVETVADGHSASSSNILITEFTFRFNRRRSHPRGLLFHRLTTSTRRDSARRADFAGRRPKRSVLPARDDAASRLLRFRGRPDPIGQPFHLVPCFTLRLAARSDPGASCPCRIFS
jgi:hypothetical protein